jgi:hypothetical protein
MVDQVDNLQNIETFQFLEKCARDPTISVITLAQYPQNAKDCITP